jgi:16S rRNA pseudouridine516 synthase
MERLDKAISSQTNYSRKDIKDLIKKKKVLVNGIVVMKSDIKVNPSIDEITVSEQTICFKKFVYLMLNKPKGYVSATIDKNDKTVLELVPSKYIHRNLFPAGRLDKDTTGLMIITDDGNFAHDILSPKKHIKKTYNVTIDIPITNEMISGFQNGVNLNDGECKSAVLERIGENTGIVILTEGRYHQIKRMFGCFGAKVVELERVGMGNFYLPQELKPSECREFTEEELKKVQN